MPSGGPAPKGRPEHEVGGERAPQPALFWVWLWLGIGTVGRAGYHVVVRDDLWGLAVGLYGTLASVFLALARRSWRLLREAGRTGELDVRRWLRESSGRTVRRSLWGAVVAALVGVLVIVVLPLTIDRSGYAAIPWTVVWSLVAVLAWREGRRRGGRGQVGRGSHQPGRSPS